MVARIKTESMVTLLIAVFIFVMILVLAPAFYRRFVAPTNKQEAGSFLKNNSRFTPRAGIQPLEEFNDDFSHPEVIDEIGTLAQSTSASWWVNSGGQLRIHDGVGETLHGDAPLSLVWRQKYAINNARDTDDGLHPQNIFRLVQINQWENFNQQAYFYIDAVNMSASPNRNQTNGLFLFNRYQTGDNLYYTGLRVDGAVVIKKKLAGTYYTLDYKKIISGRYDRDANPILIPTQIWIGLKSEITTINETKVRIRLFTDIGRTGTWTLVAEATDDGVHFGKALLQKGYTGIRTDFMDVRFDDYEIKAQGSTTAMTELPDLP